MPRSASVLCAFAAAIVAPPAIARADGPGRSARAVRRSGPIELDGRLDDAAWQAAPVQGDFWQQVPKEGVTPKHRTEFRVVYDDDAIYVGIRAWDVDRRAIRALLHRRDQVSDADWVGVMLDSYHDRRTAFGFGLNAAGVQRDVLLYDDVAEDLSWDAVWTGAAAIDADGWTAELRIPLGQLRFAAGDVQQWGLQVMRHVGRDGEQTLWSPSPRERRGFVSNFGVLDGLAGLAPRRRLEILPYATAGVIATADADVDPFRDPLDPRANAGLDVRLGLSSAMTLSATINPDFGQVEADPSEVNLTANETFFAEKRPFFVEGTEILRFGIGQGDGSGSSDALFYSRRIGAAPSVELDGAYVDSPAGTTIYGASKISGKTAGGWSIGLLEAVTAEERGTADDGAGERTTAVVEPLTNYALARIKKDLRAGRTAIGAAVTDVARRLDGTGLADVLHDHAVSGGVELDHKFGEDDRWALSAKLAGTWVHGSPAAILDTQTQFRHLYQRPDAGHKEVDPTQTSLAGGAAVWSLERRGKRWTTAVGGDGRSPGFEANDLGFHGEVDYYVQWLWAQYRQDEAGERFNSWSINHNAWFVTTFGGEVLNAGGNINANAQFASFWNVWGGVGFEGVMLDPSALRGGPALAVDPYVNGWGGVASDGRKAVSFEAGWNLSRTPSDDSFRGSTFAGVNIQARSNLELFLGPSYGVASNGTQYVDELADEAGRPHYVFARIRQKTLALTIRGAWTFTPDLSLQVYAQPFLAAGAYEDLKQASSTRADRYEDRFDEYGPRRLRRDGDVYLVDDDLDGATDYAFDVPDFDFRELRSTVVLRWQYRPGSAVFLIWSHGRSDDGLDGHLRLGRDLRSLADAPGEHAVMLKANYWLGL